MTCPAVAAIAVEANTNMVAAPTPFAILRPLRGVAGWCGGCGGAAGLPSLIPHFLSQPEHDTPVTTFALSLRSGASHATFTLFVIEPTKLFVARQAKNERLNGYGV